MSLVQLRLESIDTFRDTYTHTHTQTHAYFNEKNFFCCNLTQNGMFGRNSKFIFSHGLFFVITFFFFDIVQKDEYEHLNVEPELR